MSLLFDENLSARLVTLLTTEYPGSQHVTTAGFAAADDQAIWEFAAKNGLAIVSKDGDFEHRALLYGPPPKVVWLRIGNGPTAAVAGLLTARNADVQAFIANPVAALLVLP
jgi:predicted nuclease of predicted toxin-antitoxin system